MVLYDLKLRNLTQEQMRDVLTALYSDKNVFKSDRAISIELDQEPENLHLWKILIYHLKPKMFALAIDLIIDAKVDMPLGNFNS